MPTLFHFVIHVWECECRTTDNNLHSKQDFGSNAAALGCALRARSAVLGRKWSEEVESAASATGPATPACTPHKDAASVSGAVSQTLITFLSAAKPADEGMLSIDIHGGGESPPKHPFLI